MDNPGRPGDHTCPHITRSQSPTPIHKHKRTQQVNRWIQVKLAGEEVAYRDPREALHHGVAMIHQELNPVLDLPVYENLFLGRELRTRFGLVDKAGMRTRAQEMMATIGLGTNPSTPMRRLSVAQSQLVEIARVTSAGARLIIMDEPTSAITDHEAAALFAQLERLRSEGVAVIYISHKMEEIFGICDDITVLRDGRSVATGPAGDFTRDLLIRHMVGRELSDFIPKTPGTLGPVALEAQDVSSGRRVRSASFSVRGGEILGIAGLVGAGRSELMEAVFGLRRRDSGVIRVHGEEVAIHSPREAISRGLALITEDRKGTGLNLVGTAGDNITAVALRHYAIAGVISRAKERAAAVTSIERLGIRTRGAGQLVRLLSGGNQQKVVLAKWLLSTPDIVILDEPTRGVDVGAKREIYLLLGELVSQGKAIILISSEMPEILGLADRIVVMAQGRITGELARDQFDQERIMSLAATFDQGAEG
ncbi:MAG: sugar ABC transporter ATP-binding protein [Propionicimonas sp.]